MESFQESCPNEKEIRRNHPSFPYEVKYYDLNFSAIELCPYEDKVLDNGHLTLEVLAG